MALLALEHLRGDVVWRTANCSLAFSIELKLGGETEITDLDLHLVVEEEVTKFQVSVDDSVAVQVLDSGTNLHHVTLHFEFVKPLAAAK